MQQYLDETFLLDFNKKNIQELILIRNWPSLNDTEKIKHVYNYVRDEIIFGYNESDALTASKVLEDGYGQCNTKSILLMALLRAINIPNRIHGFTINKALQKGAIKGLWYKLAPKNILHSWVEVFLDGQWYFLEGVILDKKYLRALQEEFKNCEASFCGYGTFTENFKNPIIDFNKNHTYIQEKGINQDFGLFNKPDDFYQTHGQNLSFLKRFIYKYFVRHQMNRNVSKIRNKWT